MRGLPVPAETPPALCSCCLGVGRRGVCHSKLGFLGSWLTCPPPFAPTQPLLAWMEARVRMEVAAPSCPPGRLPACECLALSHEWALCGEAVCLLSPPLSTMDASTTTFVCVARATSCSQSESAVLRQGALESAWPGFKSHVTLLTDWDFNSISLSVLVWKTGPVTPTSQDSQPPEITCKSPDRGY